MAEEQSKMAEEEGNCCFICLSSETPPELGALGKHCKCPTLFSHRSCLTRWQLQNAGKQEEKACRFCKSSLTDWRTALTDMQSSTGTTSRRSAPIMAVVFQGKTVKVPVVTGPEGVAEFKRTVCKLFNLPDGTDFEVTFECKSPVFGDKLHLKGFDCFEAASYCAAVSAQKRATHKAARAAAAAEGAAHSSPTGPSAAPPAQDPNQPATPIRAPQQPDNDMTNLVGAPGLPRSPDPTPFQTSTSLHSTGLSTSSSAGGGPAGGRAAGAPTAQRTNCSPSFVRRLLCGAPQSQPEDSPVGSPQRGGGSRPEPVVPAHQAYGPGSSSGGGASERDGDRPLATMASNDPPAAHVATTASPGRGAGGTGQAKTGRPIAASLSGLFRRVL